MSTITMNPPSALPGDPASVPAHVPTHGDRRMVFRGVTWEAYRSLSRAYSEGEHVRLAYDGKDLEIMTTGNIHENVKELLILIVQAVASWSRIAHVACGETTWDAIEAERGLQADLSYYFDPEKVRAAREALARGSKDPANYPRPDLAVEIDMSRPQVDRPGIYAALRVIEVWRIGHGRTVTIEHLQPDGSYALAEASRFLPLTALEIQAWLTAEDVGQEEVWYCRLNEWAVARFHPA
jgi:Uma2 family endonuclease